MIRELTKGLFRENPIFVVLLGLCPALGVSTTVANALGMGAGTLFVLIGSNIFVSLLKDFIPEKVRIPSYIVIIASFVTIVEMVMQAYAPDLYNSLGYSCPLSSSTASFWGGRRPLPARTACCPRFSTQSEWGSGFTLGLTAIALVREFLGSGTITLFPLAFLNFEGLSGFR